ncbi:hypothetical protein QYE76_055824 [Lolium multiflorum]|uniref:CCHC-type domain-containing protein n=1 Tax=Lolium multiflorum TaxID=4521 RepID=A0AAD8T1T6_LOLMU|nr:hypothetical protein QYE76_055824 [Lolium multiflorum]
MEPPPPPKAMLIFLACSPQAAAPSRAAAFHPLRPQLVSTRAVSSAAHSFDMPGGRSFAAASSSSFGGIVVDEKMSRERGGGEDAAELEGRRGEWRNSAERMGICKQIGGNGGKIDRIWFSCRRLRGKVVQEIFSELDEMKAKVPILPELFSMLKSAEVEIRKEHQVLMVNKTTSFKKQGNPNFKKGGKKVVAPPEKPKAGPKPDTVCYYCKEKGHWKRNCPKYLADLKSGLIKKKEMRNTFTVDTTGNTTAQLCVRTPSKGKIFVAKNRSFLEKEFLTKEVTRRKVELDEVVEPSLVDQSSAVPEDVPVQPAPIGEEANDDDHETSNKDATEPRRSTRARTTPDWYDPCLNVMIVDNNDEDSATYEEAMMSPDSNKWHEAMKSEMGSMYDNQVWTLVDLSDSRKAVENK